MAVVVDATRACTACGGSPRVVDAERDAHHHQRQHQLADADDRRERSGLIIAGE
jgi:hypothetical protein